jgi:Cys-tRNA(Pro)/Cys-tRNA(Cys) deacylase
MAKSTPATAALKKAGIAFTAHIYEYDHDAEHIGMQAAEALGMPPSCVLKTLMLDVDGKPACAVIPSDHELAMKKVAAVFGGKNAEMMKPADAERLTGYHVGGISPFGQRKKVPTAIETTAMHEPFVLINGGQRGMLLRLAPVDALRILNAQAADMIGER